MLFIICIPKKNEYLWITEREDGLLLQFATGQQQWTDCDFLAVFMFYRFRSELLSCNDNKFLFSMAAADLLVCVFGTAGAFLIPSSTTGKVKVWKLAGLFPLFRSCFVSILALVVMNLDRLTFVVYALRYHLIMTDLEINVLISLT